MTELVLIRTRRVFFFLMLLAGLLAAGAVVTPNTAEAACSPSWNGQYSGLLAKLNIPGDRGKYGNCYHWGKWSGSRYKGYNVPNGSYWVYSYPHWYVWQTKGGGAALQGEEGGGCSASWNGKYAGLIAKLHIPGDRGQYGACHRYGKWNASNYKGHSVPSGSYWVYKAPHWYVWRNQTR